MDLEAERLRTELADATAKACAAYQDNARLVRVLSIIAQPSTPQILSVEVLRALSQTYNADLVCLVRLLGDRLIVLDACGLPEDDPAFTDGWPVGRTARAVLWGTEAVGRGESDLVGRAPPPGAAGPGNAAGPADDAGWGDDADVPAALAPLGIRSAAWVPVRSEQAGTGTLLVLYRTSSDVFVRTELRGLESVATRLAAGVEARERSVLAERLARSGHRLARHLNFSSLYREAALLMRELLGAGATWVVPIDGGDAQRPWPSPHVHQSDARWPRPAPTLPGWPLLASGRPYRVSSGETSPLDAAGVRPAALMCVPVMSGTSPAALLYAARDPTRPFLFGEVEAVTTFANYLHSAMINTELYQALKENETIQRHRATHDVLTGLPNRHLVTEYLENVLSQDAPTGVGLLFCDLDKFKGINDRLGHGVGDSLLCQVADRLRECLREGDLLARLGGDEFVFVLDGIEGLDDLTEFGERVTTAMLHPFVLCGEPVRVTVSVGAVWGRRGQATSMSLLRDADAAMYAAKARGTGLVRVFDDEASLRARELLTVRSDLRSALERGQLSIRYQPIFDLADGAIFGFEALLRWTHPVHGTISPERFVPIAEDSGDIVPISTWVLAQACRQLARWQRLPGAAGLSMSVNLSPLHLHQPTLARHLLEAVRNSGVDPGSVWLEITERGAVHGADAKRFAAALRAAGMHFSLDDFGTSNSNLSHLRQLPVECLKIDRSFVAGLTAKGHQRDIDRGLVQAVLAIGESLDLSVVAEGVETPEQRAVLSELGCRLGQGFLLSGPVTAPEAAHLLRIRPGLPGLPGLAVAPESPLAPAGGSRPDPSGEFCCPATVPPG